LISAGRSSLNGSIVGQTKPMPHFRVLLKGINFWLNFQGKRTRMGFNTGRFVEAVGAYEAELAAVNVLRGEEKLTPLNDDGDYPRVFADEIEEVDISQVPDVTEGFVFFPDEGEEDA
jgi:hypothetical protein